jgi:hypothetical protein
MSIDMMLSTLDGLSLANREDSARVQYLCNTAFSDYLKVTKNTKFPGSMAVSLTASDLPLLAGFVCTHISYKPSELVAWTVPTPVLVPPLNFATPPSRAQASHRNTANPATWLAKHEAIDLHSLEFIFSAP